MAMNRNVKRNAPANSQRRSPLCVKVQKPESQSKRNRNDREVAELAQSNAGVSRTKPHVETDAFKLPHNKEPKDARVQQQHLSKSCKSRGPGGLKPAQIDGESQHKKHSKIPPVSDLMRVSFSCLIHERCNRNRQERIESKPTQAQHSE